MKISINYQKNCENNKFSLQKKTKKKKQIYEKFLKNSFMNSGKENFQKSPFFFFFEFSGHKKRHVVWHWICKKWHVIFGLKRLLPHVQNDMSFFKPYKMTCHFGQTTENQTSFKRHVVFLKWQLLFRLNDMSFFPYRKNNMSFSVAFFTCFDSFDLFFDPFWPDSNTALRTPFWVVQIIKLS